MAGTSSSSVLHARQQVAGRLREIRLDAGLTLRAVSESAGWHESKASRIEGARTRPSDSDIQAWCRVCGAEHQAADLVAAARGPGGGERPASQDRRRRRIARAA
jgi:transcriptional regulator with XRE-family HTH domain